MKRLNLLFESPNKYFISSQDDITKAKTLFYNTIQQPTPSNANEQGIKATLRALQRARTSGDKNFGFIRSDAALSVIVVTDANEGETGAVLTEQNDPANLYSYITQSYPGKSFKFHSIIVQPGDNVCKDTVGFVGIYKGKKVNSINEDYGITYANLSQMTSGIVGDVCQADYTQQITAIGSSSAAQILMTQLSCDPVDSDNNGFKDIEVRSLTTQTVLSNYVVNNKQVIFDRPLPVGDYVFNYRCVQ